MKLNELDTFPELGNTIVLDGNVYVKKREPFGPEERQRLSRAYSTKAEQVAFEEGIIFAEISYGIGGEE